MAFPPEVDQNPYQSPDCQEALPPLDSTPSRISTPTQLRAFSLVLGLSVGASVWLFSESLFGGWPPFDPAGNYTAWFWGLFVASTLATLPYRRGPWWALSGIYLGQVACVQVMNSAVQSGAPIPDLNSVIEGIGVFGMAPAVLGCAVAYASWAIPALRKWLTEPEPQTEPKSGQRFSDPCIAHIAQDNFQAQFYVTGLSNAGIDAEVLEDLSPAGAWLGGLASQLHRPKIWVDKSDLQRAQELILGFENTTKEQRQRDRLKPTREASDCISVTCEDCGATSNYPSSQFGSVQTCKMCWAYVDVGEAPELDEPLNEGEEDHA